jgi:hypothetical protein
LVTKNKLGSYTSDKTKEIMVAMPIPTIDKVPWGVQDSQHIYKESRFDDLMKNFHPLDVDYRDFHSRTDYILACMRAGISTSFDQGFTVNKEKIKSKLQ